MNKVLHIKNLSVMAKDDKKFLLQDVSIQLYPRELLAVVGNSGAGKSILCHSILGLKSFYHTPFSTSGEILYRGKNLLDESAQSKFWLYQHDFAFLPQDPLSIFDTLYTVQKHMIEVVSSCQHISHRAALSLIKNKLEYVGLSQTPHVLSAYPSMLSRGTLQRLALALCLSKEPRVLIMDEPTSALDAISQAEVLWHLAQIVQKKIACLMVTHHLGVVAQIAHRIVVLDEGRICEEKPLNDFFSAAEHPTSKKILTGTQQLYTPKDN